MARCCVYEVKGTDPTDTAGAERCARATVVKRIIDGKKYALCDRHRRARWSLFVDGDWLTAIERKPGRRRSRAKTAPDAPADAIDLRTKMLDTIAEANRTIERAEALVARARELTICKTPVRAGQGSRP
jgi:hypothetical protein